MNFIIKAWNRIPSSLHGIVLFVIVLLVSNYFWELTIRGDEDEVTYVTFLGLDISAIFEWGTGFFAARVHEVLDWLGIPTMLVNTVIRHPNGHAVSIISGCTAFKQMFIMLSILIFARGPWLHKMWYVPLAMLLIMAFNVFRLSLLAWIVRDYAELFDLFHLRVMKYLFYGFIFAIWIVWDELLRPRLSR